jgi:cytochrome c biogenesis protein CcdA/thiol-disulfide isomerase/thioredoxin
VIEIILSFIEGFALIVSPCILPVLPLVLGASISGGRKRPFGIILGFVLSFTAFVLIARKLVMLLNINLNYIKYGSLFFLTLFGLILFSEKLSAIFGRTTQNLANIGESFAARQKGQEGFLSGIMIGALIGLVWTPCAGPILAAVLVQVIRQQSDIQAFFLLIAFAIGAGVPMLFISLLGRKLVNNFHYLTTHVNFLRKFWGVLILFSVAFIASGLDIQTLFNKKSQPYFQSAQALQGALKIPYAAPEFSGIESWLNSKPLTIASLKGKVVLIDFWTYSCINCVRTLPYLTTWDKEYRDKGLVIIGVHAPEFEFEKNKKNVEAAIATHHIHYPVALDNNLDTWTNFNNHYWPAHYLINKKGQITYTHFGEGNYAETENNMRVLLGLNTKKKIATETSPLIGNQTPETYLGYDRNERFAGPITQKPSKTVDFSFPENLALNYWALKGKWLLEGQRIISKEKNAAIQIHFTAKKVFLVMGTEVGEPIKLKLILNGNYASARTLIVDKHTLYELVNQDTTKDGILEIIVSSPGLAAYAFTFGS